MTVPERPLSKKIAYTGSLLVNSRTIHDVYDLFEGNDSSNTIHIDKLSNLLQMLEALVMSPNIFYDGTLPFQEQQKTERAVEQLINSYGIGGLGCGIKTAHVNDTSQLMNMCKSATKESFELIKYLNVEISEKPLDANVDISKFLAYFSKSGYSIEDRHYDALNIAQSIIKNENTFHGSKCLIGLLITHIDEEYIYDHVKKLFDMHTDNMSRRIIVSGLINRFRINFLGEQANESKAAYLANTSIEPLRSQQVFLFWKYVGKKLLNDAVQQEKITSLTNNSKQLFETFPIGLSVFMNSSRSVDGLIKQIEKTRSDMLNRLMTAETVKNRYIHTFDDKEFQAFEDELFANSFKKLNEMPSYKKSLLKGTRFLLFKGIFGTLSGGTFSNLLSFLEEKSITDFMGSIFGDQISSKFENISGIMTYLNQDKYHDYIPNHKNQLINALRQAEDAEAINRQVEKIFDKKLII
ncbi:MAG: hypothetical protein PHO27_00550 [Sulfuricurvum sp.]|nr:hypothetical protein [Sulfuricurvum sp.]